LVEPKLKAILGLGWYIKLYYNYSNHLIEFEIF
jgi:hypothetical protein